MSELEKEYITHNKNYIGPPCMSKYVDWSFFNNQDGLARDDGFLPRFLHPLPKAPNEEENEEDDCINVFSIYFLFNMVNLFKNF
jgi:hypothetical protein